MPVLRQGFSLVLPEIEIAKQCRGVRSSASLLIAGLLALFLLPLMIFKNAVRIVDISLLGVYLDRSYFFGSFHHQYRGLAISALAVTLLLPVIWRLRKSEAAQASRAD